MHGKGPAAAPGAEEIADQPTPKQQRLGGSPHELGPFPRGKKWSVGDTDGGDLEHRSKMESEPCTPRVVATGCIYQEEIG